MVTSRLLKQECKRVVLSEAARDYTNMRKQLVERAVESKKKDFIRGEHIDPVGEARSSSPELPDDPFLREGHGRH